ncbi:GIY-YIG nuclease family protein [Roseovarius sp. S1116L3]|uniref:GIY-YIG nuclease family protein n=1 Tax=Roseovarius roseus TaxID=3342636 RepID=UPI003729A539
MIQDPKYTRNADIIRAMRPFQREAAQLIVHDVVNGSPPATIKEAQDRYRDRLGEGFSIDNGKGWRDDIRDTSVHLLIKNGFAKACVVTLRREDGRLSDWSRDRDLLNSAAKLEFESGGNRNVAAYLAGLRENCRVYGNGGEAVYVYTDSRLDETGSSYCKIGRHLTCEIGAVAVRVLSQYGTGSAGVPVLRYVFRTDDAVALETRLHHFFSSEHAKDAFGDEWFKTDHTKVLEKFESIVS